jgi:hypothetical protein
MYKQNLLVTQSIHPVIGVFEVVLRNSIYNALSNYFQDENWIVNQKEGFMSDKALVFRNNPSKISKRNDFLKREVLKAEQKLKMKYSKNPSMSINAGNIIAEQSFGFWTNPKRKAHSNI